jgi:CO dehydrogenase maturation factor
MSLKIAIAGKGGTGKTTMTALLCRSLMNRAFKPLLAVDADPNSCLPEKLGVKVAEDKSIGSLREQLRAEPEKVPQGISKSEWVERLINEEVTEALGFDVIVMGRQEGPNCYCYINNLLRNCIEKIGEQYRAVIIDNEAGLEHLSRRTDGRVEVMLIVCQPTISGARTALRIRDIMRSLCLEVQSAYLLINRCDSDISPELMDEFKKTGLEIIGRIPSDPVIGRFEDEQKSLIELPADSKALQQVEKMMDEILKRRNK